MDRGENEAEDDKVNQKFISSNDEIATILKGKIENFNYSIISNGEHHYTSFKARVSKVLSSLY